MVIIFMQLTMLVHRIVVARIHFVGEVEVNTQR